MFYWKVIMFCWTIDFHPLLPHTGCSCMKQWRDKRSVHLPSHSNFQVIWMMKGAVWLKIDRHGSFTGGLEGTTLLLSPGLWSDWWRNSQNTTEPSIHIMLSANLAKQLFRQHREIFFSSFSHYIFFSFFFKAGQLHFLKSEDFHRHTPSYTPSRTK